MSKDPRSRVARCVWRPRRIPRSSRATFPCRAAPKNPYNEQRLDVAWGRALRGLTPPPTVRGGYTVAMLIPEMDGQGVKQFLELGSAFLLSAAIGLEREIR